MNIGLIGAGKVGKALGLYFKRHALPVAGYCSRSPESAREAAQITETGRFESVEALAGVCDVLFLTTPDHALADVDRQAAALLRARAIEPGKVWIHASGAYPSDCLTALRSAGGFVGSMHPLQSFGDPEKSAALLEETYFSIEGMPEALEAIRAILQTTGGRYSEIGTDRKALYHAGACVISNYLVTLLDCGMRLMEAAGMERETLFEAVSPLIAGTLQNIGQKGTADALTGPIVRGDCGTVSLHLEKMRETTPEAVELYRTLALETVKLVAGRRLSHDQEAQFQELLKGSGRDGR